MRLSHDGYRLIARRDGNRVRLYTRRGYDWSRWHATYNPSVDDRWISAARGDMSYELERQNGSSQARPRRTVPSETDPAASPRYGALALFLL